MTNNTDIFGRKIFFIAANESLIIPSYLEKFCTLGYETHIIKGGFHMHDDLAMIVQKFPDSLLLFNADADITNSDWLTVIRNIHHKYNTLLVGVIFKADNDRAQQIQSQYENTVSPKVGCIALHSNDEDGNFLALKTAFERSGAKGRRNSIRAACDSSSRLSFKLDNYEKSEKIEDVNISHFRCVSNSDDFHKIKIYDKIRNARIRINGLEFTSDIVLIMKRKKEEIFTAIFMFIKNPDDCPGLEPENEAGLNKKIYQITVNEFAAQLKR